MQILYVAFKDFSKLHFGASKKVLKECAAFEAAGHTVTLIGREGDRVVTLTTDGRSTPIAPIPRNPVGKLQPLTDKNTQMATVARYVADKAFDFCYIRYDLCTGKFLSMLRAVRRVCPRIFLEIPTYPYDREYSGRLNRLRLWYDGVTARKLCRYVDRVVTFYPVPDGQIFGIPCLIVPNGFDFSEVSLIREDAVPEDIHIAAVSSMREWHGYERMLTGMYRYYTDHGERAVYLHLVGDGRECGKYRELTARYGLEERVVFHGALHSEALDALLESCTLGVDSLARHRTGIAVLSSLKSREYGAKGIPFINSCAIDIIDDTFPYMLQVPADESPVDIRQVVEYYDRIFAAGSRLQVAQAVRAYIEVRSDMHAVMRQVLAAIPTHNDTGREL